METTHSGLIFLTKTLSTFLFRSLLIGALIVLFPIIPGCSLLADQSSDQELNAWTTVQEVVRDLRTNFEQEDTRGLTDLTHQDYERYRSELRNNLNDVFRTYSNIELTFYGSRTNRSNERIEADVRWDLRWICQRPDSSAGDSCDEKTDTGTLVKQTGRTILVFEKKGEDWLLINQKRDVLFGSLTPGQLE